MLSRDIQEIIEMLNENIDSLQHLKYRFIELGKETAIFPKDQPIKILGKLTRKQQLIKFLIEKGSHLRRDIIRETGISRGTLATLLLDKETFVRLRNRRWDVRKQE